MIFLVLLIIPSLIAMASFFWLHNVDWKEFLTSIGVQIVIAGISTSILYYSNTSDVEIWSGQIYTKIKDKVSCSHSYDCNCIRSCTSDSKGNQNCKTTCQTCYEHSYDINWILKTTNNELIYIDRVDRQGLEMPSQWYKASVGEPTAVEHTFTNYIKAAPDTLFRRTGYDKIKIPNYPNNVYDYYKINRVISDVAINNQQAWNEKLSYINSYIDSKKQSNLIVVITKQNHDFFFALQQGWLGGKKNDVILVIGTNNGIDIQWVDVLAWSQDESIKIQLRDAIMDIAKMDKNKILDTFGDSVVKYYKRKPMHDFEYLKSSITPTSTQLIITIIIGALASIGLAFIFHKNDIFRKVY